MLDIKATFENGEPQHFGEPGSLLRYMQEENRSRADVTASYIFTPFCRMQMNLGDVERWERLRKHSGDMSRTF